MAKGAKKGIADEDRMSPGDRLLRAKPYGRQGLEKLYNELGFDLNTVKDVRWRQDAIDIRRQIESELGPQGRVAWDKRKYVTLKKPSERLKDRVSLVIHDPISGEIERVVLLSQLSNDAVKGRDGKVITPGLRDQLKAELRYHEPSAGKAEGQRVTEGTGTKKSGAYD